MRTDPTALALRWALSWFLFSLVALFLYLAGTAQSFLASTLANLFLLVRWSAWLGLLGTWLILVPLTRTHPRRLATAVLLGAAFAVLFSVVLIWGAWLYPDSGVLPW